MAVAADGRAERARRHFIDVDRLADAFDPGRTQRLEREIALDQLARVFTNRNRSHWCDRLQARREVGRMADRRIFGALAGLDRSHHDLAGMDADANLDWHAAFGAKIPSPVDCTM